MLKFNDNKALEGGAICIGNLVALLLEDNSVTLFHSNLATVGGGAIKVLYASTVTLKDNVDIKFTENRTQYGGAIFQDTIAVMTNNSNDTKHMNFIDNIAKFSGDSVYLDLTVLCNSSCLNNK